MRGFLVFSCVLIVFSGEALAQGGGTPAFHWGGIEFPALENSATAAFSLIQFTEFDKKTFPTESDNLIRYNDIDETFGFNVISISRTRQLRGRDQHQSNLYFTPSIAIGVSWDNPTRYYQNQIIHKLRGIPEIERKTRDQGMIAAYGGELNYRFLQLARDRRARSQLRSTPVFAGAGFNVGSIHQDFYVHAGMKRLRMPQAGNRSRWIHGDLSVIARFGFLLEGLDFEEVAQDYSAVQVSGAITLLPYKFPVRFEYALMGHSGMFLEPRGTDELSEFGRLSARRQPMREVFSSFRVALGSWTFETFNDSRGSKDRGPTYGARFWITTYPGEKWYKNLFHNKILGWL